MKAKVWAEWAGEVEVDVHPEEIAAYLGSPDKGEGWLRFINRCATGLAKVPDEAIAAMGASARATIAAWYLTQAARYANKGVGHTPEDPTP